MSEMKNMKVFADQLWQYMVPKLDSKFSSNVSYFRAQVVTNLGNNMLEVQRPLENGTLTLPCTNAMSGAQAGQQVVALVMGSMSNAVVIADGKMNLEAGLWSSVIYGPSLMVSFDGWTGGLPIKSVQVQGVLSPTTVVRKGKNLFDKNAVTNQYIGSDGSISDASNARLSVYIPINGVCTCSVQRIGTGTDNLLRVALYDASKTFLSRKLSNSATAGNYNTVKVDDNTVKYVRVGIFTGSQDINTMQVELGNNRTAYVQGNEETWTYGPATDSLTPPVMSSLPGENHIWSYDGNVTVEYGRFLQAMQQEIEKLQ